jgi:hypothetical protein
LTGAQLNDMGLTRLRIATRSGNTQVFDGPFDGNAFDNTCTDCNCAGNQLAPDLYWSGGRGGCNDSTHFGLSRDGDVHLECSDGDAGDDHWGHFHRAGVNTGVYGFGDSCISENEWDEWFMVYGDLSRSGIDAPSFFPSFRLSLTVSRLSRGPV